MGGLGKTDWPKRAERLSLSHPGHGVGCASATGLLPALLRGASLRSPPLPRPPEQTALNAIPWAERCELLRSRQAGFTDTECGRATAEQRER